MSATDPDHPRPHAGRQGESDLAIAHLRDRVKVLEDLDIENRLLDGESKRKWYFWSQAVLLVLVLALFGLVAYLLASRDDARRYYNTKIQQLVCSLPPDSELARELRAEFPCSIYKAPVKPPAAPAAHLGIVGRQ